MRMRLDFCIFASLAALVLVPVAAQAQQLVSRTTDVTLSVDPSNFAAATGVYTGSVAYPDQAAFSNSNFTLTLLNNASGLKYQQGGGISVPSNLGTVSPITVPISGNGTAGYWGWSYNTGVGDGLLSLTNVGGYKSLNFNGGGSISGDDAIGIYYYVYVHVLEDWTKLGTAPGDLDIIGVGRGFSAPVASYHFDD